MPGYAIIEYRRLNRMPQLGEIMETMANKKEEKAIRALVAHVHLPEQNGGDHIIYLDQVSE